MQETGEPFDRNVLILDGGFGTTLEDVFHKNISTSLWSARLVTDDPEGIIEAHLAFLRAGADIVLTSTYQISYETAERAGFSREETRQLLLRSVALAAEARRRFLAECASTSQENATTRKVRIALSLGPYGAMLSPAQEFSGFYPPPYGPRSYGNSGENYNAFGLDEHADGKENEAVDALAGFHLERLQIIAEDLEAWNAIDFVAFETVPLLREVVAIRKAMGQLLQMGRVAMKPWWISMVYPNGAFPAERRRGGDRFIIRDVVDAAFQPLEGGPPLPSPSGFGINCTSLEFLEVLLDEATGAVQGGSASNAKPFLVIYPNRGDVYDPSNQSWLPGDEKRRGRGWAHRLVDILEPVLRRGVWGGAVVGGCCKTGPDEISALATVAEQKGLLYS